MINSKRKNIVINVAISFVLLVAGTLYCLYYGRIGYMPMDSATVFDGGWRILSGQIPFRDFTLPNAIVPVFIQALFFQLFSVNWFFYCLHAAIFNGLFCVLVFFFLRMFGGSLLLSSFYAMLSGVVFYAPFGIPVQDQHAYFFTFLLIFLVCLALRSSNLRLKQLLFISLPFVAMVAFLSKQIPTVFGIALGGVILLIAERKNLVRLFRSLLIGSLAVALILTALYFTFGINFELLRIYFFQLPAETAGERFEWVMSGKLGVVINDILARLSLFSPFVLVTALFLGILIYICKKFRLFRTKSHWKTFDYGSDLFPLLLAQGLLSICYLFVVLTNNQAENGVPLIFVSLGLAHISVQRLWNGDGGINQSFRFAGKKHVLFLMGLVFVATSLFSAWSFDRRVNATRTAHDFYYKAQRQKSTLPEALSFLVWGAPKCYRGKPVNFQQVIKFFQHNDGNFFLLGDSSILYALTGRPSVNPVLWFHPGQTLPYIGSRFFPDYQERLLNALLKYHVRYIVLEATQEKDPPSTWTDVNLEYIPALAELVKKKGREREHFGPFTIIELVMPLDNEDAR